MRDFFLVKVEAQDIVAEIGKAGAGDQAHIAGADDGDFQLLLSKVASSELIRARTSSGSRSAA